jgi:hypothetical protein
MEQTQPHRHVAREAYRPRLYGDVERRDPIEKYNPANTGEIVYRNYVIRREPEYQLWQITNYEGKQITGMHGMYTTVFIAQAKIDEYLKREDEKAKNSTTSN